jgi:methyltransferase (TIGR00027 family)
VKEARPSATAYRVAMRRAAHQMLDNPKVLDDPIAVRIIGERGAAELRADPGRQQGRIARSVRAFMAARSRFAEDELARAVERGVRQYVILGAGLDTFAYRVPEAWHDLRVFEVDFPATQEWKRRRLEAAGIAAPAAVSYVPVDFEKQGLAEELARAGLDASAGAFFSWLGVTMYLAKESIVSTLRFIAATSRIHGQPGGGVAFDYTVPRASLKWMERIALDVLSRRVAAAGEPFVTSFEPRELAEELRAIGFRELEDIGTPEINDRYFKDRADGLRVGGSLARLMAARV